MNTRDLTLDFLKGISMIMVVFFHNIQLNPASFTDNLFMLAANAAVPCFFLVSGSLFFQRPFDLRKHIWRMIRFYLIVTLWRAIYLAFYISQGVLLDGSLRTLCSYLFFFQTIPGVETSHFWFMDAMLTVMLAAPLFHICWKQNRIILFYCMGMILLFNQLLADGNLLLNIVCPLIGKPALNISPFAEINPFSFRYSNYMLYYLLGAVLTEYKTHTHRSTALLMMILGLSGLVIIKYLQSGTFLWQEIHITSGYYWISTMFLACGTFLLVRTLPIGSRRLLSWFAQSVGTSTMGIFYLHIPMIFLLRTSVFTHFSMYNGWLLNLTESFLITAVACAITWLCKKIPFIKYLFHG
ncbi:MAG: acyltransferase [Brotaphodocola sp.]